MTARAAAAPAGTRAARGRAACRATGAMAGAAGRPLRRRRACGACASRCSQHRHESRCRHRTGCAVRAARARDNRCAAGSAAVGGAGRNGAGTDGRCRRGRRPRPRTSAVPPRGDRVVAVPVRQQADARNDAARPGQALPAAGADRRRRFLVRHGAAAGGGAGGHGTGARAGAAVAAGGARHRPVDPAVERESLQQAGSRERLAAALQAAGHPVTLAGGDRPRHGQSGAARWRPRRPSASSRPSSSSSTIRSCRR